MEKPANLVANNVSRARHAIFGAIIGDALGTTFEFSRSDDARKIIIKHNNFKNGLIGLGPFGLVPGQFTDDTEMSLAIMSVIFNNGSYDQKLVSKAYHSWYLSNPFDMGQTTRIAVSQKSVSDMLNASAKYSKESLSNGFLMRLFGLVGLYYNKTKQELVNAIVQDVMLTHSHPEAVHIGIIYGLMLHGAIQGMNTNQIYLWGKNNCTASPLITSIYEAVDNDRNSFMYNGTKYVLAQIDSEMIGFVGYAFWLLLRSLKYFSSYEKAMLDIVGRGGDTDTNACIVGAVMGALYPDTIPKSWIKSVLTFDAKSRFQFYPMANPKVWAKWLPL